MPKYLIEATYTQPGAQGLVQGGGSARAAAVAASVEAVGGRLEAFYFAFGSADAIVLADLPDNVAAAAVAMAVNSAGGASTRTSVLLTPDEVDRASRVTVPYRAPGK